MCVCVCVFTKSTEERIRRKAVSDGWGKRGNSYIHCVSLFLRVFVFVVVLCSFVCLSFVFVFSF